MFTQYGFTSENTMPRKTKFKVGKSRIHGQGLFAASAIDKDATLGVCQTTKTDKPGDHTLWLDSGPVDVTCELRFINHSKKPNVAYYDDLSVVALRKIKRGEELTHDYGDDWE